MKNRLTLLIILIAMAFLTGCKEETVEKEVVLRKVLYSQAIVGNTNESKDFSGTIKSSNEANVSFRVAGNLISKTVGLGETVTKGDVIAKLDDQDYQIALTEAKATLAEAQATAAKSEADFRRYKSLFLNDNASKADYDNAKAAHKASLAKVVAVKERVKLAGLKVSYTNLIAPFTGEVSTEFASEGENLNAATPVYRITKNKDLEVNINLPEDFANKIKLNDTVKISVLAVSNELLDGTIKEIGSGITGLGNTLPVVISLSGNYADVKAGMTAKVMLSVENKTANRFTLPLNALTKNENGEDIVYSLTNVQDETAILKKTVVELGELKGDRVEIISGINLEDKIVVAGINYVFDGQQVKFEKK